MLRPCLPGRKHPPRLSFLWTFLWHSQSWLCSADRRGTARRARLPLTTHHTMTQPLLHHASKNLFTNSSVPSQFPANRRGVLRILALHASIGLPRRRFAFPPTSLRKSQTPRQQSPPHPARRIQIPHRPSPEKNGRSPATLQRPLPRPRHRPLLFHRHPLGIKRTPPRPGNSPNRRTHPRRPGLRRRPPPRKIKIPHRSAHLAGRPKPHKNRRGSASRPRRPHRTGRHRRNRRLFFLRSFPQRRPRIHLRLRRSHHHRLPRPQIPARTRTHARRLRRHLRRLHSRFRLAERRPLAGRSRPS